MKELGSGCSNRKFRAWNSAVNRFRGIVKLESKQPHSVERRKIIVPMCALSMRLSCIKKANQKIYKHILLLSHHWYSNVHRLFKADQSLYCTIKLSFIKTQLSHLATGELSLCICVHGLETQTGAV